MKFDSLQFVCFSFVAVTLLRAAQAGRLRDIVLLSLNIFFLSSFAGDPLQLMPLIVFVVAGYGIIYLAQRSGSAMGITLLLLVVVAAFVWLKRYSAVTFLPLLTFPYLVVGLSYIVFRIIHLVVDVAQGATRIPRPIDYLNYIFFFLTFVSGPIQRFQDFAEQAAKPQVNNDTLHINLALERVIRGYFMIIVVCSFTSYLNEKLTIYLYSAFAVKSGLTVILLYTATAATQLAHLYFNFAGYMHICIGIGCLAGFTLPENFHEPYKTRNFLDLWSRWHITLSEWFKFYLFNPILKAMCAGWGTSKNTPYLGVIAFFCTFLVMGIWHGTSDIFVFYGLLLASGAALNKLWQIQVTKWLGKNEYNRLSRQSWYALFSRAATLSFFAIALTCIWIDPAQVKVFANLRGMMLAAATFFVLSFIFAVSVWLADRANRLLGGPRTFAVAGDGLASSVWIALKIFVLVNLSIMLGDSAPLFVYMRF